MRRHGRRGRHIRHLRYLVSAILLCLVVILTTGCQIDPPWASQAATPKAKPSVQPTAKSTTPVAQSAYTRSAVGSYATMERGFSLIITAPDAYASSDTWNALNELHALGVNAVTFTTSYSMATTTSSTIGTGRYTATDSALATGIRWARQLGMRTTLALYVDPADGSWRARIHPANRILWFTQYGTILNHLAEIAAQNKVDHLCIGVELISMSTSTSNPDNTGRWLTMIKAVRARYHGSLLYAANWGNTVGVDDEFSQIHFWKALDEVGIDAYFPVALNPHPTLEQIAQRWGYIHDTILSPFARAVGLPIVFTEVGYRSIPAIASEPYNSKLDEPYDGCAQAQAYYGLLESWKGSKMLAGIYWWYWSPSPNIKGPNDTTFSPHGKPAATVVASFWGGQSLFAPRVLGDLLRQCP